ncbi:MAG: magnesium transporter CorA, partial [Nitrococcus sp.]|nr:magnesium transporter CorA [Nitrococcus sp.]
MLNAFALDNGILKALQVAADSQSLRQAIWIDLTDPSDDERERVEALYRQDLPDVEDVEEI